jgi:hypothetical protein
VSATRLADDTRATTAPTAPTGARRAPVVVARIRGMVLVIRGFMLARSFRESFDAAVDVEGVTCYVLRAPRLWNISPDLAT